MQENEPIKPEADRSQVEANKERDRPRIYVASLADYNAGRLFGSYIDAAQAADEIERDIRGMLARSPTPGAEEWAIHDYQGFGPLRLHETESLEYVAKVAKGIVEHGLAFAAWAAEVAGEPEALDNFDDAYHGAWDTVEAYVREFLDDLSELDAFERQLPEHLRPYARFDFKSFAHDLVLGGDILVIENPEGGVWIFDNQ